MRRLNQNQKIIQTVGIKATPLYHVTWHNDSERRNIVPHPYGFSYKILEKMERWHIVENTLVEDGKILFQNDNFSGKVRKGIEFSQN